MQGVWAGTGQAAAQALAAAGARTAATRRGRSRGERQAAPELGAGRSHGAGRVRLGQVQAARAQARGWRAQAGRRCASWRGARRGRRGRRATAAWLGARTATAQAEAAPGERRAARLWASAAPGGAADAERVRWSAGAVLALGGWRRWLGRSSPRP
ncbi:hypothetical protein PAHAL_2G200800 [Panicum hallii]|uniref:Uncharacterized protein n=1 Tax=Panicum hallii TaxID=206008 RepID=A0A2T8KPM2_9POAL|nr:hypothetical protein PAHAL_2G200800 [Panicum hallii]